MNLLPVPRTLELGRHSASTAVPRFAGSTRRFRPQGYELRISEYGVELVGADEAGLFYGEATLAQLERLHDGAAPVGSSSDHPDLPVRGVMLDISRDKVPTMDSLRTVIDRLASLKVNQVQLYSEHTFAYRGPPRRPCRRQPAGRGEIRQLDAFCRARHVELVPNQNCLGHMNRWLAHDRATARSPSNRTASSIRSASRASP